MRMQEKTLRELGVWPDEAHHLLRVREQKIVDPVAVRYQYCVVLFLRVR